tara:strand:- start:3865 stop:4395 length:531 start_codon:yes stop_codon:yes gene_type:complete
METSEYMEPVDIVEMIAQEHEWPHSRHNEEMVTIQHQDAYGHYHTHAAHNAGGTLFSCTREYAPKRFSELEVLRLLNLVNKRLEYGSMTHDLDAGFLIFKLPCDHDDDRPLERVSIEGLMARMEELFTQYFPAFLEVAGELKEGEVTEKDGIICLVSHASAEDAFERAAIEQYGHA